MRQLAAIAMLGFACVAASGQSSVSAQAEPLTPRAVIGGIASDRDLHPVEEPLRGAEQRWAVTGIDDYTITLSVTRFGPSEHHVIEIENDEIITAESRCFLGGEEFDCGQLEIDLERFTVPGLFAFIHQQLLITPLPPGPDALPGTFVLDATFSEAMGFPLTIAWSLDRVFDSGEFIQVERLSLPGAAEDLASARARWAVSGWYEYSTVADTFDASTGAIESRSVHVRGGAIVDAATSCSPDNGAELVPCALDPGAEQATVEGMFALVETLLADPSIETAVLYNVVDGHVERIEWGAPGAGESERGAVQVVRFDPLH